MTDCAKSKFVPSNKTLSDQRLNLEKGREHMKKLSPQFVYYSCLYHFI